MSSKHVIAIVGPPRSGKSTLAKYLSRVLENSAVFGVGEMYRAYQEGAKLEEKGKEKEKGKEMEGEKEIEENFEACVEKKFQQFLSSDSNLNIIFFDGIKTYAHAMWFQELINSFGLHLLCVLVCKSAMFSRVVRRDRADDDRKSYERRKEIWNRNCASILQFLSSSPIFHFCARPSEHAKPRKRVIVAGLMDMEKSIFSPLRAKKLVLEDLTFRGELLPVTDPQEYSRVIEISRNRLSHDPEPTLISSLVSSTKDLEFLFSTSYLMSSKCDGTRFLAFFFPQLSSEKVYFLDRKKFLSFSTSLSLPSQQPLVLDVEVIRKSGGPLMVVVFDLLLKGEELTWRMPFISRLESLQSLGFPFSPSLPGKEDNEIVFGTKEWYVPSFEKLVDCVADSIESKWYPSDGVVFYDTNRPYQFGKDRHLFKYQTRKQLRYESSCNSSSCPSSFLPLVCSKKLTTSHFLWYSYYNEKSHEGVIRMDKITPDSPQTMREIQRIAELPLLRDISVICEDPQSFSSCPPLVPPSLDSELVHPALRLPFQELEERAQFLIKEGFLESHEDPTTQLTVLSYTRCCPTDHEEARLFRGLVVSLPKQQVVALPFVRFFKATDLGGNDEVVDTAKNTLPAFLSRSCPCGKLSALKCTSVPRMCAGCCKEKACVRHLGVRAICAPKMTDEIIQLTEKYDGTFVIVFRWNGELRVCTKRRFDSEQAVWTRLWIKQNWSPEQASLLTEGSTYLFEAVYPNNRVVIDYNFEGLVLLSVISAEGREWSYSRTAALGLQLKGVKVPTRFVCYKKHFQIYIGLDAEDQLEGYVIESGEKGGGRDGFDMRTKFIFENYQKLHMTLCHVHPFLVWQRLQTLDFFVEKELKRSSQFGFEEVCRIKSALLDQLEDVWVEVVTSLSSLEEKEKREEKEKQEEKRDREEKEKQEEKEKGKEKEKQEEEELFASCFELCRVCVCSRLFGGVWSDGNCDCACHRMSILPYLIRSWVEKEQITLPNLVIELKNFQERNVVISEMRSLFASVRGDSLTDKFSCECVALYQTLLGFVKPREVFPRSELNSPLLSGYTPSEHFQQTYGKSWGDENFIDSQKTGDLGTLAPLPIEVLSKIFRFVGMENSFRCALVSKYWYFVISSVFCVELREAVTNQVKRQQRKIRSPVRFSNFDDGYGYGCSYSYSCSYSSDEGYGSF